MVIHYHVSPIRLFCFVPLPVSPDKKCCYHYDIDYNTHRKKTNHGIIRRILRDGCRLLYINGRRNDFGTRIRSTHFEGSPVCGLSTSAGD